MKLLGSTDQDKNGPHSLAMLNTIFYNTNTIQFSSIEVWLTDQNSKQLEIEDNVNMTLITG